MTEPVRCPECGSNRFCKDGIRYVEHRQVQRFLCKSCGLRFSVGNSYKGSPTKSHRQVCELLQESKNLTEVARQEAAQREGTLQTAQAKGTLVEFAWWLRKEGYGSSKNRFSMVKRLADLGANLEDPESVKSLLAKGQGWTDSYKMLLTYAYESYLRMEGRDWQRPVYRQIKTIPFIPTEDELDQLISGSGKKLGIFLQGLKDTGADPGELAKLKWKDINTQTGTVSITPVKGHKPRMLKVSEQFLRRTQTIPRKSEYVFNYVSTRSAFQKARKYLSKKLSNPRLLAISFTTFRHWKGTMEYHRTHDIIHVKELLGHMRIDSTMIYINLETAVFTSKNDQFYASVATNPEQAVKLIEAGFDYVTGEYDDGGKLFRKRK
jgi:integrase